MDGWCQKQLLYPHTLLPTIVFVLYILFAAKRNGNKIAHS